MVLLPALLAGGRRVWRCSQLVVARTLHCSCAVCLVCGVWVTYIIQKKSWKKKLEKKKMDMNSARLKLTPSNPKFGHRDHLTITTKIHTYFFRGARRTRDTAQHSKKEMTDDGSQPPIEQLATAVHRGSATRSWCGPLLLVCAARRGCHVVGVLCMLANV